MPAAGRIDAFTNREAQFGVFRSAAYGRVDALESKPIGPVTNLLVFFGMAGIGKSELSIQVQR